MDNIIAYKSNYFLDGSYFEVFLENPFRVLNRLVKHPVQIHVKMINDRLGFHLNNKGLGIALLQPGV